MRDNIVSIFSNHWQVLKHIHLSIIYIIQELFNEITDSEGPQHFASSVFLKIQEFLHHSWKLLT